MQQDDDYWQVLQVLLGVVLVGIGLRFALPKLKFGLGVVMVLVLVVAAFIPGVPTWFSIATLACGAIAGMALWRVLPGSRGS